MRDTGAHFGYVVALFDVLGFEQKLKKRGLTRMADAYEALIAKVEARNEHMATLFGDMEFSEAPYWCSDGDVFIFNTIRGAFASDSILLWAHRTWEDARNKSLEELDEISRSPADGWLAHPIPCDNFLDTCNELMCHSIEVGLPVRGAIAMGAAVIDESRRVFLGQPIVDAARMEQQQIFLGASLCASFTPQIIPKRYAIAFTAHLKDSHPEVWGELVLDWPRHWRKTRSRDARKAVAALDTDPAYSAYYQTTLRLIRASERIRGRYKRTEDVSIRAQYPEFSSPDLAVRARAVRRVPLSPDGLRIAEARK